MRTVRWDITLIIKIKIKLNIDFMTETHRLLQVPSLYCSAVKGQLNRERKHRRTKNFKI